MSDVKKRFIAGAVCPRCSAVDTLMTYCLGDESYRECVDCGFVEKLRFKNPSKELTTRVNKTEKDIKDETQVVNIVEIKPSK